MKQLNQFIQLLFIVGILLSHLGCSTSKKVLTPLVVPDFEFSPPNSTQNSNSSIVISLIEPMYTGNFAYAHESPFLQFRKNMSLDFQEILVGRGYKLKGPFEAYDLMTYSDKTECELGLEIQIDLNLMETSGGWKHVPSSGNPYSFKKENYSTYKSTLNLSGTISISIIETFTKQKLIVKSVPVPQENIAVVAESTYEFGTTGFPLNDPGVHNPLAVALSRLYKTTTQRGWDLLANEDLEHALKQVPEIRTNAGFIKR